MIKYDFEQRLNAAQNRGNTSDRDRHDSFGHS